MDSLLNTLKEIDNIEIASSNACDVTNFPTLVGKILNTELTSSHSIVTDTVTQLRSCHKNE